MDPAACRHGQPPRAGRPARQTVCRIAPACLGSVTRRGIRRGEAWTPRVEAWALRSYDILRVGWREGRTHHGQPYTLSLAGMTRGSALSADESGDPATSAAYTRKGNKDHDSLK